MTILEDSMTSTSMKIGFIGGGNMAYALISGLTKNLGSDGLTLHVVGHHPEALARLAAGFGALTHTAIEPALGACDVVVMAVKPQQMRDAALELAGVLSAAKAAPLVLSVAAGIRMRDLAHWLGGHAAIVRCMPNTPALIGAGIAGMVASAGVTPVQRAIADLVMQAVGSTLWLDDEAQLDAVTAISGSGPAYVFYFIEALQQAASELGLSQQQGTQLALATFTGAAQLAAQSAEPVALLRERVTSKGGTTFAALKVLQEHGVGAAIVQAAKAAAVRSAQLGDEFGA